MFVLGQHAAPERKLEPLGVCYRCVLQMGLRPTSRYPVGFANALYDIWAAHRPVFVDKQRDRERNWLMQSSVRVDIFKKEPMHDMAWSDARLSSVLGYLQGDLRQ